MNEIKTVSIIGLGALGIMFGHHLAKRMPTGALRIVADRERIARYEENGLYSNGERCSFHYITPEASCSPADLLIFAVKYRDLPTAIQATGNQVGENTIILSLLNGISSEALIEEAYGVDKVLYCVAQGMDAGKAGNRVVYEHMGMLCFGEREPGVITPKARRVADFFERTQVPYEVEARMYKRLWGKFMLNVGVNQTVAVYESSFREIQREGEARRMMIAAMREVILLSEKEGVNLTEADLVYWLRILDTLSPEGKPSMRQDMEARRCSELELFAGTVLELGRKHGIATPVNRELYDRIHRIECTY